MRHNRPAATTLARRALNWTRLNMAGWHAVGLRWIGGVTRTTTANPSPHRLSESTRYLCAAVQLDEAFRAEVLRSTVQERHHAIAPSFGVDVPQVVKHCLVANRRELIRDACLTLLLIALVPALLLGTLHSRMTLTLLILTAAYAIFGIDELCIYHVIETRLRGGRFRPYEVRCNAERNDVLAQVADRQNPNMIVFGRTHPFVGSGGEISSRWSWSLTVDIRRQSRRRRGSGAPTPFRCRDLYDHVARNVNRLELQGVTVEERLYINGRSIRDTPLFLPDQFAQPAPRVDPSTLELFVEKPTPAARHYQCIQAITWGGDLILTFLLQFDIAGGHLFIDTTVLLVGPIHRRYREIDSLPYIPLWKKMLRLVPESAKGALVQTPRAPLRLIDRTLSTLSRVREEKQDRDLISNSLTYNYGALTSLREQVSSPTPAHHFQVRDTHRYVRILETRLIHSIEEFLDERGVDTGPLRRQGTTIVNNGVYMEDGKFRAENVAVGKGASIAELGAHQPK